MSRMPAIFFGHGNPMNAILDSEYSRGWRALGAGLPTPKAVLCVSAHWYTAELAITAMPQPRTIHDFGGFPRSLYEVQYPAPGDPALARRVQQLLAPADVRLDEKDWGLDHGTWSVLCHVFPGAGVPVVQLSIDETRTAQWHYELAKRLAPLRDEGVLVIGSGNVVHNLHAYAWGKQDTPALAWAVRFDTLVRELISEGAHDLLTSYEALGEDGLLSVPTPDHYLPLIYVLGVQHPGDPVSYPVEGFDGGSVSMLTVRLG